MNPISSSPPAAPTAPVSQAAPASAAADPDSKVSLARIAEAFAVTAELQSRTADALDQVKSGDDASDQALWELMVNTQALSLQTTTLAALMNEQKELVQKVTNEMD